ncbi:pYEATS domain-containing protein [Bradyrhizobium sp. BR 1432]|uniref:pYEATS domain-containing protein n=1 Tax=Bradyrhizobium sp. BR 1432 TaxID=3447966 RepID=UPI003EE6FD6E
MAEVLLDALAIGGDPLDARMLKRLDAPDVDPLLRLYAAGLIVSQLARKGSPALDDPYPAGSGPSSRSAGDPDFENRWRGKALDLIKGIVPQDSSPDLFSLRWELGHSTEGRLTAPTMLAISWECAARHSAGTESAVPDTASFRGASLGRVAAGPWLAWRPSAARETSLLEDTPKAAPKSLNDAFSEFASGLDLALPPNTDLPALHDTLSKLSLSTRGLISAARDLNFAPNLTKSAAASLAGTLLTPAGQLRDRLQQATQELAAAKTNPPPSSSSSAAEPPALHRPITRFDDPQKGRFGGQSEKDGFALRASFAETNDPKWVQINLVVTAAPGEPQTATEAEFFLHDTFRRERVKAPFRQGEAHLPLRAFGGFTVGVWIASHQVELELDLAELPDAPTIVKEW